MPFPPEAEETRIRSSILSSLRTYFDPLDTDAVRFYAIDQGRVVVGSMIDPDDIDSRPKVWVRQLPTAIEPEAEGLGPGGDAGADLTIEIVGGVTGEGDDPYRARERLAKDIERAIKSDPGAGCNATLSAPVEKEWGASEWDIANGVATEEICRVQVAVSFDSSTSDT